MNIFRSKSLIYDKLFLGFSALVITIVGYINVINATELSVTALERVNMIQAIYSGDSYSQYGSISGDGNFIAFMMDASDLVDGDTNGAIDIAVLNRSTGEIERVSVASDGTEGNSGSPNHRPAISYDGRYVAFISQATNLVLGDTNNESDVFVHDRETGITERISVSSGGTEQNGDNMDDSRISISNDGRYVVFNSNASNLVLGDTNTENDVFLRDRQNNTTERISLASDESEGNESSGFPSISSDGNYVVFSSEATNLVPGDTNNQTDIFIRNISSGTTERVSVSSSEEEADNQSYDAFISSDGNYVVFLSTATNLVPGDTNLSRDVFVRDINSGTTERVSVSSSEEEADLDSEDPGISGDGRYVIFVSSATNIVGDDTNGVNDVFVRDLFLDTTERVSVTTDNEESNDSSFYTFISSDGNYILFTTSASNLVESEDNGHNDLIIRNLEQNTTEWVIQNSITLETDQDSYLPSISEDNRYIIFESDATNLINEDTNGVTDIFVLDRNSGEFERISVTSNGTEGNGSSDVSSMSLDGRYIAFESDATNLVAGDTNGDTDVFVHDRQTGETERVSVSSLGEEGDNDSGNSRISANGRYVVFTSQATNLVDDDENSNGDIFLHDRQTGITELISVTSDEIQANGESDLYRPDIVGNDGQFIIFTSNATNLIENDENNAKDIFIRNRDLGTTERVSVSPLGEEGDNDSNGPAKASFDGRYIAFESDATNLVAGDTNGDTDVFVHDRQTGETERVSVSSLGEEGDLGSTGMDISPDGRLVAFYSYASNLVENGTDPGQSDIYLHDRNSGKTIRLNVSLDGDEGDTDEASVEGGFSISFDNSFVVFGSFVDVLVDEDTNEDVDIFLASLPDLEDDERRIVSSGSSGSNKSNENVELPVPGEKENENKVCEGYLPTNTYLSRKRINNKDSVVKLQTFLKIYGVSSDLYIDGIFGEKTEKSVKELQKLYFKEILSSQGFRRPTGIVAGYTTKKINDIVCFQPLF